MCGGGVMQTYSNEELETKIKTFLHRKTNILSERAKRGAPLSEPSAVSRARPFSIAKLLRYHSI